MMRPIPQLPAGDESLLRVLRALKENQEQQMGVRGAKLAKLPETASNAEIIAALNALIDKVQG